MEIIINGESRAISPIAVSQLLAELAIDPRRVAVELNLDILPKSSYEATLLSDGYRLEIVHFVGGG